MMVAPLLLDLVEGAVGPLKQVDERLPLLPLGDALTQGEVGSHR